MHCALNCGHSSSAGQPVSPSTLAPSCWLRIGPCLAVEWTHLCWQTQAPPQAPSGPRYMPALFSCSEPWQTGGRLVVPRSTQEA